jgi:hypothetical protein
LPGWDRTTRPATRIWRSPERQIPAARDHLVRSLGPVRRVAAPFRTIALVVRPPRFPRRLRRRPDGPPLTASTRSCPSAAPTQQRTAGDARPGPRLSGRPVEMSCRRSKAEALGVYDRPARTSTADTAGPSPRRRLAPHAATGSAASAALRLRSWWPPPSALPRSPRWRGRRGRPATPSRARSGRCCCAPGGTAAARGRFATGAREFRPSMGATHTARSTTTRATTRSAGS